MPIPDLIKVNGVDFFADKVGFSFNVAQAETAEHIEAVIAAAQALSGAEFLSYDRVKRASYAGTPAVALADSPYADDKSAMVANFRTIPGRSAQVSLPGPSASMVLSDDLKPVPGDATFATWATATRAIGKSMQGTALGAVSGAKLQVNR